MPDTNLFDDILAEGAQPAAGVFDDLLAAEKPAAGAFDDILAEEAPLPAPAITGTEPAKRDPEAEVAALKADPGMSTMAGLAPETAADMPQGGSASDLRFGQEFGPSIVPRPNERPDTWVESAIRHIENLPAWIRQQGGALLESVARSAAEPPEGIESLPLAFARLVGRKDSQPGPDEAAARERLASMGREVSKAAAEEIRANAPNVDPESWTGYSSKLTDGFLKMAPMIAIAMATKSPALALSEMGVQVYGETYAQARDKGRTDQQAKGDAIFSTVAETIPEVMPLGFIMKSGGKFLPRVFAAGHLEGISETMTETLQIGYDAGILKEDMTWGQARDRIAEAWGQGVGMGKGMAAVTHPFGRGTGQPSPPPPPSQEALDAQAEAIRLLSPGDRASPIPDEALAAGRKILEEAAAAGAGTPAGPRLMTAPPDGQGEPIPPLGSDVRQETVDVNGAPDVVPNLPGEATGAPGPLLPPMPSGAPTGVAESAPEDGGAEGRPSGVQPGVSAPQAPAQDVAGGPPPEPAGEQPAGSPSQGGGSAPVPVAPGVVATTTAAGIEQQRDEETGQYVAPVEPTIAPAEQPEAPQYPKQDELKAKIAAKNAPAEAKLDTNLLGSVTAALLDHPAYNSLDVESIRLSLKPEETAGLRKAGIEVADNGEVSRATADRLLAERDRRTSKPKPAAPPKEQIPLGDLIADSKPLGVNAAGEPLHENSRGRFRVRKDRRDQPEGYADFGGDLAPTEANNESAPSSNNESTKPPVGERDKRYLPVPTGTKPTTGLETLGDMGKAISQNGYDRLWKEIEAKSGGENGAPSAFIQVGIRIAAGPGGLTREQIPMLYAEFSAVTEGKKGPAYQQALSDLVGAYAARGEAKPEPAKPASVPIADARQEQKVRESREAGAKAAKAGEERTPPDYLGEDLKAEWLAGYASARTPTSENIPAGAKAGNNESTKAPPAQPKPAPDPGFGASNKVFTASAADAARARMLARLKNQTPSGMDPEMMKDGLTLAGFYIEGGARKFADYSAKMIGDFGEAIRPYLRGFYENVRYYPGMLAGDMTPPAEIDALEAEAKKADVSDDGEAGSPETGDVGKGGVGETGADGAEGKPDGEGSSGDVAPGPAKDGGSTRGGRGGGSRSRSGQSGGNVRNPVPQGGDGADGRPGAGGKGMAPVGAGGRPEHASLRPNYYIADPERLVGGSPKVRFARNRKAIEAYRAITEEGRDPTADELDAMAGYTGWGAFGQELFKGTWERPYPKDGWAAEDTWMRQHLGKAEWESANSSILNAHYTDPPTVTAMWDMVRRLGFTGGRVLEPSMGIGNFFGLMPRDMMASSQLTGIELDKLTGGMATLLYPQANVQIKPYQASKTADNFYDLVIGNWPFAAQSPADRRYDKLNATLHDYFFVKALDQVRPGGLVVGITSAGTMDKMGRTVRLYLARNAELVAAFRMPSGAFKEYAGTAVVADIIILKKREKAIVSTDGEGWVQSVEREFRAQRGGTETLNLNEYWQANPTNVLGLLGYGHGTTSGHPGMIVTREENFPRRLAALPGRVPEGVYAPITRGQEPRFISNNTRDREGSLTVRDDTLYVVRGERLDRVDDLPDYKRVDPEQLKALIGLRQAYGRLIDAERAGQDDTETLRADLKSQYQAFVRAHGAVIDSAGGRALKRAKEPFYSTLAALETKDGRPARILDAPTTRARRKLDRPSVSDALVLQRNESAILDLGRIASLAGKTEAEVAAELMKSGAVFATPGGGHEIADVFLSGNVRRRLRELQEAKAGGETGLDPSIAALENAIPADVPYYKIGAGMGATWIPNEIYAEFIQHMLGVETVEDIEVNFAAGRWKVRLTDELNRRSEATTTWGVPWTRGSPRFDRLVSSAMGNQTVLVRSPNEDGDMVVDDVLTAEANNKVTKIREALPDWLWKDAERRVRLERSYNDVMNAIANPSYDGSFLEFPGMALQRGDDPFSLRQHQADAIWRGIANQRGLYAHEVGTGKTYTIGGIAVESRRYGLARKPLLFAHNANSAAVAREIQEMYPGAHILYIDNLSPDNIEVNMRRIANDEWDLVVMPHSLIDRIGLTEETLSALAAEEIAALEEEAMEAAQEDGADIDLATMNDPELMKRVRSPTAKDLVKQRNRIIEKIAELAQRASREGSIAFEELGVDMIMVDEVHEFKKPPFATKMRLRGLNVSTSDRAISLRFLTDYVKGLNGGKGVHIFSGTPITNTMAEIYHMQRYVMDQEMAQDGIKDWDAWFNTFAEAEIETELTSTGSYEPVNRLRRFVNVAELRRILGQYMDIVFADDMPEFVPREVDGKNMASPDLTDAQRAVLEDGRTESPTGRPYKKIINDIGPLGDAQRVILTGLIELANQFKNASKKDRREMMLSGHPSSPIIVDGNAAKAGLDARLYDKDATDHPENKAHRTVRNVLKIYRENDLATQAIFVEQGGSDYSTRTRTAADGSKVKTRVERFNMIKAMVDELVAGGIPREQIAIVDGKVSNEKRKDIADKMNAATIRVVIGNTDTLGTGINMQVNLRAMHHMDAPWMPGELEQRNGRGWRQGNKWNTVLEFRYITERLDGKRWQVLAVKERFIRDFLKADENTRVIEGDAVDLDTKESMDSLAQTLSAAAGDPRIMLKNNLRSQIERLENRERMHSYGIVDARERAARLRRDVGDMKAALTNLERDLKAFEAARADGAFSATIDGKVYTERKDADAAIAEADKQLRRGKEYQALIGTVQGVEVKATGINNFSTPYYSVGEARRHMSASSVASAEGVLRNTPKAIEEAKTEIADKAKSAERMIAAAEEPFAQEALLSKKREQFADLLRDMAASPEPAPEWLRAGAPVATKIYTQPGFMLRELVVEGHQHGDDDYYILVDDGPPVPYQDALNESGTKIYESRPFEPKAKPAAAAAPSTPPPPPASKFQRPYYSALADAIPRLPPKGTGAQMLKTLENMQGVKGAEIAAVGLDDWLKGQERVTREQVAEYVAENAVEIKEVHKGGDRPAPSTLDVNLVKVWLRENLEDVEVGGAIETLNDAWEGDRAAVADLEGMGVPDDLLEPFRAHVGGEGGPKFNRPDTTLPGGVNYREILLTLPGKPASAEGYTVKPHPVRGFVVRGPDGALVLRSDGQQAPMNFPTEEKARAWIETDRRERGNGDGSFAAGHFPETPNTTVHFRVSDRIDADGKRVLFVEEIQDDWAQKARKLRDDEIKRRAAEKGIRKPTDKSSAEAKAAWEAVAKTVPEDFGYMGKAGAAAAKVRDTMIKDMRDEARRMGARIRELSAVQGMPANPAVQKRDAEIARLVAARDRLVADTEDLYFAARDERRLPDRPWKSSNEWGALAMRRVLKLAVDEGYDRVAWTPGEIQNDRYNLAKKISEIHYSGTNFVAYDHDGGEAIKRTGVKAEDLPDLIGKEVADRLMEQKPNGTLRSLRGLDLQVGGSGMIGFYDKMLVNYANAFGKKYGARASLSGQPEGIRKQIEDFLGRGKPAGALGNIVDAPMIPALQNDKVMGAVVRALPVDVVNVLSRHGLRPESLAREPKVLVDGLPGDAALTVADGFRRALAEVGARLRAGLNAAYKANFDREILPTLRAGDIDSDIAAGIVRLKPPGSGPGVGGSRRGVEAGGTGAGAESRGQARALVDGGELSPAELADFERWHRELPPGDAASFANIPHWQLDITPAMREALADKGVALFQQGGGAQVDRGPTASWQVAPDLKAEYLLAPEYVARRAEIADVLFELLKKLTTSKRAVLNLADLLTGTDAEGGKSPVSGAYSERANQQGIIESIVSLALIDPKTGEIQNMRALMKTLNHEVLHFLWERNLLTTEEKKILTDAAEAGNWIGRHKIKEGYADLDHAGQIIEAIAEERGDYALGKRRVGKSAASIFDRIGEFFEKLKNWLNDRGFRSFEDIMRASDRIMDKIGSGEIGRREEPSAEALAAESKYSRPPRPPGANDTIRADDPETEARRQQSQKGVGSGDNMVSRVLDWGLAIAQGFDRHWIDLPNTPRFSDVAQQLLKLQAAPHRSKDKIVALLKSVVAGMTKEDLEIFSWKIVLDDLTYEVEQEHLIPFGLTPDTVVSELAKVDAILARRPDLADAVERRKVIVQGIKNDLVAAGILSAEDSKNPAYYRHQVLMYAMATKRYAKGVGKSVRTPYWAKREGSVHDINLNYLEAEFDHLHKSFVGLATVQTIDWIKEHMDLHQEVVDKARQANEDRVGAKLAADMDANGYVTGEDRETGEQIMSSPLNDQWKGFKQRIAIGLGKIRQALEDGDIDVPPQYHEAADDILSENENEDGQLFNFVNWMLTNSQPGSMGAAMIFKAVTERREWTKALLGDKFADTMNPGNLVAEFAPEGYVAWQPDDPDAKGKALRLFVAKTVPEHAIDGFVRNILSITPMLPESAASAKAAFEAQAREVLAVGGPRYQMIIPQELADTLSNFNSPFDESVVASVLEAPTRWWKVWTLFNPRRAPKYIINNWSGDFDAVIAGNPGVLKKAGQARREIWDVLVKGKEPTNPRYAEALDRNVFQTGLTLQEIPDINSLSEFEALMNPVNWKNPASITKLALKKGWGFVRTTAVLRESIYRYAAYLDYIERIERGDPMDKIPYGASNRPMVEVVEDPKDRAALLARDLLGDYANTSVVGQRLARFAVPFWRFQEINIKRYYRLTSNAFGQGIGKGLGMSAHVAGTIGVKTAAFGAGRTLWLLTRMGALYASIMIWNALMFPDDDDEMDPEERARLHVNLGRWNGERVSWRISGASSDAFSWMGFGDALRTMQEVENGRASVGDILAAIAKAPFVKAVNSVSPLIKGVPELAAGIKFFPDVTKPVPIRDRWRYAFDTFTLGHEYDALADKPSRGYGQSWKESVVSARDSGAAAYGRVQGIAHKWLEREKGVEGFTTISTEKSRLLREWKQAQQFGDQEMADRRYDELTDMLIDAGETPKTIKAALKAATKNAHPLNAIPNKHRPAFMESLTADEARVVDMAIDWYVDVFQPAP